MKKIVAYAASAALAFSAGAGLSTVANADPGGGGNANNQLCKQIVPFINQFGPTLTHGNCMSFLNAGKPNANAICNFFAPNVPNGDCIPTVNAILNS